MDELREQGQLRLRKNERQFQTFHYSHTLSRRAIVLKEETLHSRNFRALA